MLTWASPQCKLVHHHSCIEGTLFLPGGDYSSGTGEFYPGTIEDFTPVINIESAILDNQEARAYYEQHRSWRGSPRKRARPLAVASPASPGAVKPDRDEQRVRQRYLRMSKEALAERLITAERTLAEQRERWLGQQDEALTWRLRAEAAEAQLKKD